jgi:hypothetical protein
VGHIAFQRLEDGGPHRGGGVTVEQPQQTGGDGAETAAMLAGRVFEIDQRLDVGGLFDPRALVVTARVTREHRRAGNDAYLMGFGEHRQNAPDMRERDLLISQHYT